MSVCVRLRVTGIRDHRVNRPRASKSERGKHYGRGVNMRQSQMTRLHCTGYSIKPLLQASTLKKEPISYAYHEGFILCTIQQSSSGLASTVTMSQLGVDRLSAPILSILPIIDIGHFQNRFADNFIYFFCMQTNILFTGDIIYWWINNTGEII